MDITIATLLWQPNQHSRDFSRCYSPEWVDKLYRGFKRNLTRPFSFICFTDQRYEFSERIYQLPLPDGEPDYSYCIAPYQLGVPMILCGLDTVVTGNCDALVQHCLNTDRIALPRDPYKPSRACNGVALVPRGKEDIYERHRGENDMAWCRAQPHNFINNLLPGQVVSYKARIAKHGIGDARIVYFHGEQKPHQINHPVLEHWI